MNYTPRTYGKAKGRTCKERSCRRSVYAKMMCKLHYSREYYGYGNTPKRQPQAVCGVEGCDVSAKQQGLCGRHFERFRKHGDPLYVSPTRTPLRASLPSETSPTRLAKLLGVSRQRADQLLNKRAHNARIKLQQAVAKGVIVKPEACERCLEPCDNLHGHHWDYREPLDVRWLCAPCHGAVHAQMNAIVKAKQEIAA